MVVISQSDCSLSVLYDIFSKPFPEPIVEKVCYLLHHHLLLHTLTSFLCSCKLLASSVFKSSGIILSSYREVQAIGCLCWSDVLPVPLERAELIFSVMVRLSLTPILTSPVTIS